MPITTDNWRDMVRDLLIETWLEQACRCPADRPAVQERLLERWGPLVAEATAELAEIFGAGVPNDPTNAVWRAFARLDRERCARLSALLIQARGSRW